MRSPARAKALPHTDAPRPAPAQTMPTPTGGRPTKTERPQRFPQREPHPITIMSPTRHPARSRTEISMGARAHESDDPRPRNHSPPTSPDPRLTRGPCRDKWSYTCADHLLCCFATPTDGAFALAYAISPTFLRPYDRPRASPTGEPS